MMPDLGKYAFTVLASYGATLALLAALLVATLWRGAKVKAALERQEQRGKSNG